MLKRVELRKIAQAALKGATLAGDRVYSPQDLPTWSGEMPILILRTPEENKESLGRTTMPQFTTTATLQVTAQLEGLTADRAESDCETIAEQIQRTLINNYDLTRRIQQFAYVRSRMEISGDASKHVGVLTIQFGLEYYEGPEDFAPVTTVPLKTVTLTADMAEPFDASGIYNTPPFPAAVRQPPRTSGPDGRAETGFEIDLPQ